MGKIIERILINTVILASSPPVGNKTERDLPFLITLIVDVVVLLFYLNSF